MTAPTGAASGLVLLGRYRLDTPLPCDVPGSTRWKATDKILDRVVEAYILSGPNADRAVDAAQRAALATDPRLVRLIDAGHYAGVQYILAEPLVGPTLANVVPLPEPQARAVAGEVAAALEAARQRGLHHQGLRPEAIYLGTGTAVQLTGLAWEAEMRGTAQTTAAAASRRDATDLVAILYTALTGRWPGATASDVLAPPSDQGRPVAPSLLVAGVSGPVDSLCSTTLGLLDDGPQSPGELVEDLSPWPALRVNLTKTPGTGSQPVARAATPPTPTPVVAAPEPVAPPAPTIRPPLAEDPMPVVEPTPVAEPTSAAGFGEPSLLTPSARAHHRFSWQQALGAGEAAEEIASAPAPAAPSAAIPIPPVVAEPEPIAPPTVPAEPTPPSPSPRRPWADLLTPTISEAASHRLAWDEEADADPDATRTIPPVSDSAPPTPTPPRRDSILPTHAAPAPPDEGRDSIPAWTELDGPTGQPEPPKAAEVRTDPEPPATKPASDRKAEARQASERAQAEREEARVREAERKEEARVREAERKEKARQDKAEAKTKGKAKPAKKSSGQVWVGVVMTVLGLLIVGFAVVIWMLVSPGSDGAAGLDSTAVTGPVVAALAAIGL